MPAIANNKRSRSPTTSPGTEGRPTKARVTNDSKTSLTAASSTTSTGSKGTNRRKQAGAFPASAYKKKQINPLTPYQPCLNISKDLFSFELSKRPDPSKTPLTALIFGTGDMGQFGLGTDELDEIPKPKFHTWFEEKIQEKVLGNGQGVADLEAGGMHTLTVGADGTVYSWGINDNAALGRITNKEGVEAETLETQPLPVEGLDPSTFKAVSVYAGDSISLAISDQGEVRAWGSFRASEGLLGFDNKVLDSSDIRQFQPVKIANVDRQPIASIACGSDHVLALTTNGTVFVFGNGEQQQLGRKIISRRKENGLAAEPLGLKMIKSVGAGSYHSFAIDGNGNVYAWGLNSFRQTGVSESDGGDQDTIVSPTIVESLNPKHHDGAHVVAVDGGEHHSLFLFSNGQVWGCGRCDGFEVGLAEDHPEMVAAKERKEAAKRKQEHIKQQEEKKIIDQQNNGQEVQDDSGRKLTGADAAVLAAEAAALGAPLPNDYIPTPTKISFPKDDENGQEPKIIQISAGSRHNFAVSNSGKVYAWGLNDSGQIGLGSSIEEQDVPKRVVSKALENTTVLKATTGGQHSLLLGYKNQ